MAEFIDVIYFLLAGFNIIFFTMMGVNFLLGGFFAPYLRVKASRGSRLLVKVLHPVQSYFRTGKLEEGFLIFTDREKNERRIQFVEDCIDRSCGVYWTTVDDEKNAMVRRFDGKGLNTFDAVKYDELYKRALYKPDLMDDKLQKIMLIIVCVLLIVAVVCAVLSFRNMQMNQEILTVVKSAGVAVVN